MVPGTIAILLVFIPAMLMALGVVREKELGSITNLYVTPVTRLEFLLGKQLPYISLSMTREHAGVRSDHHADGAHHTLRESDTGRPVSRRWTDGGMAVPACHRGHRRGVLRCCPNAFS